MKSKTRGASTLDVEVSHINSRGLWLCVGDKEYFLSYQDHPWFKEARVKEILNLKLLHGYHLYWPDLDVDLELDSLENPDAYPLIYK